MSSRIRSLDMLTPIAVMNKNDKVDKSSSSGIIRNLAKFKNFKNFAKYKKLIRNLFKFKFFERPSFLNLITRLIYMQLN